MSNHVIGLATYTTYETTYAESRWKEHDEDADSDEEADDEDRQENGCPAILAVSRMHCRCIIMLSKQWRSIISEVLVNTCERVHDHIYIHHMSDGHRVHSICPEVPLVKL